VPITSVSFEGFNPEFESEAENWGHSLRGRLMGQIDRTQSLIYGQHSTALTASPDKKRLFTARLHIPSCLENRSNYPVD
jgi:hypothetical protein